MNVSVCRIGLKIAMCFAQHFIAMEHTGIILLTNEISRDLSLTRVSEGDILYWNSLQARITPGFTGANVRQGSSSTFIDMNGIIFIHGETHGRLISSTWHCFDIEVLSVLVAFCEWISLVANSFSSQKGNWYETRMSCLWLPWTTAEQTVKLSAIWEAMTLTWHWWYFMIQRITGMLQRATFRDTD